MSKNSLGAKKNLNVGGKDFEIFDISKIEGAASLPFSLKVLLENLLRTEDGANITADHIKALAQWDPSVEPDTEIQFTPARANADVNWYTSQPTVPMSYLLGRLEVEKLHRHLVLEQKWPLKKFNDWMLSHGAIPYSWIWRGALQRP